MIHCRSKHRHCQSTVTPKCYIVGAHLHNAAASSIVRPHLLSARARDSRLFHCQSTLTQCLSVVVPEYSIVGPHLHSVGVL
ncbi:hypothetical protein AMTR_s00062p00182620 [Amborella trichopoda]|uniref:Uncharacterized protein n=1 Tax=Amborella trichopoda TaxID=13333 RepID=U5DE30_AMBTC|nr:hypothetical protein AMTR_s00062p00182620 [Amborella trichopoda]